MEPILKRGAGWLEWAEREIYFARLNLNSEMGTTEYSEHTETKRVAKLHAFTQKVITQFSTTSSFSVYYVYSVVPHLPF